MTKSRKQMPDDPEQSKRFIETARQLSTDEKGEKFKLALKRVKRPKTQSRSS